MAERERYDLVVVGAGPGGYVACVRAARLGLKTACIEKDAQPGGVCLNVGCIPSKALLDSSENYHMAGVRLAGHGVVMAGPVGLDLARMMARKEQVVRELSDNVRRLLEGSGIKVFRGFGRLLGPHEVEVVQTESGRAGAVGGGGEQRLRVEAGAILLATGSEPVPVPGLPFDGTRIVSSTEALAFDAVPRHLGIVGAGYIGLELGSVWLRLGSKVTVIEMMPKIAATLDGQVARALERLLVKQGFAFKLGSRVVGAQVSGDGIQVAVDSGGAKDELVFDRLLVAVGRRPLTRGLGLEEVGVAVDPGTGRVVVDGRYRTSVPSILAIGDLIEGPMLAHKASAEGIAAVDCLAGLPGEVDYDTLPAIVYTAPEVASVGLTEEQAKERSLSYCVGIYPFSGIGRARCMGETDGFVKILTHSRTDRILGVHIMGPRASDMIAECSLAVRFGGTSEDIAHTIHGHPTFSEALHEASLAVKKCSPHAA